MNEDMVNAVIGKQKDIISELITSKVILEARLEIAEAALKRATEEKNAELEAKAPDVNSHKKRTTD